MPLEKRHKSQKLQVDSVHNPRSSTVGKRLEIRPQATEGALALALAHPVRTFCFPFWLVIAPARTAVRIHGVPWCSLAFRLWTAYLTQRALFHVWEMGWGLSLGLFHKVVVYCSGSAPNACRHLLSLTTVIEIKIRVSSQLLNCGSETHVLLNHERGSCSRVRLPEVGQP